MKKKDAVRYWFDEDAINLLMEAIDFRRTRFYKLVRESSYSWYAQYIPDACNMGDNITCDVCSCRTNHGGCYEKEILVLDNGDIKFDGVCYCEEDQNKLIDAILNY